MRLIISTLVLLTFASTARPADTVDIDTDAICKQAKSTRLPGAGANGTVAKDCDSQALYYGIGRPADPIAARACAFRHLSPQGDAGDTPIEGAAILATIYANGEGVPRDYDVAIAYACQIDGAPAEMQGRLKHLLALKAKGPGKAPFDMCDDITSGLMMGACADRDSAIAAVNRDARLAALTRNLGEGHKGAFTQLRKAEAAYAMDVADNEVDLSGTARSMMAIGARDTVHDAFASTLQAALAGELAAAAPLDLAAANKRLDATYAKVIAVKDTSTWGTVEKKGIKTTQWAWVAYRDAFVAFVKGGPTSELTLARVLTEQRTKDLEAFLD